MADTDSILMENGRIYTADYPSKMPSDSDVSITNTTTTKVSFNGSRIVITSLIDLWQSPSQKSKTAHRIIYDGDFSFSGKTLSSLRSTRINQVTYAVHDLAYEPSTNSTQYSYEAAAAFRLAKPYDNLGTVLSAAPNAILLYNYSSNGQGGLADLFAKILSPSTPSTDRSLISSGLGSTELKLNWWVDPFSSQTESASSTAVASTNSILSATAAVDTLTGAAKKADTFEFSSIPNYSSNADRITNFSTKEKDKVQISSSVFGLSGKGTFKIAKNLKSLDKLLKTDTQFIYSKADGGMYFNQNEATAGFGSGGIFAILDGKPTLGTSSVSVVG